MESILRNHGVTISGRRGLVIGYGMIGSNIAPALQAHALSVSVYDKHDYKNLRAYIDGYSIHKKAELIKNADIIFAATADKALTFEEIEECKSGVILASAGSRDTEFDVAAVREQAIERVEVSEHLVRYRLPNSKRIYVARDGTAVNFILPSIPVEVLDLVFSEIFLCIILLLKSQQTYAPGELHSLGDTYLSEVALDWLRLVNI
jgi:adenosylhomocysteinase